MGMPCSGGRGLDVFPLHLLIGVVGCSGGVGFVPVACVDLESVQDLALETGAAGGEGDVAAAGGEVDPADAAEFS